MRKHIQVYKDRWWGRVLSSRRKYFFQKLRRKNRTSRISIMQALAWAWIDVLYVKKWGLNILLQLRTFGRTLSNAYGISVWQQFSRMIYLAFYLQVDPLNLRGRQLYRPESWKNVNDYTYSHDESQLLLAAKSFPEEIELFEHKLKFFHFCRSNNIFTPDILAAFDGGKITWQADSSSFRLPEQDLFIKTLNGRAGQGIRKMSWINGRFNDHHGGKFTSGELFELLVAESKTTGIILQNVVVNHSTWADFTSGALATCRLVTAKSPDNQSIIPLFAALRMPVGKTDIDNYSKGGFYASVNMQTGELSAASGLKPVNGFFDFTHHPDTGKKVQGTTLPFWKDILEFTMHTHSKFNTFFVGWDITLTEEGPIAVEGNIEWASRSYECPNVKPLRETEYPFLYETWLEKYLKPNEYISIR